MDVLVSVVVAVILLAVGFWLALSFTSLIIQVLGWVLVGVVVLALLGFLFRRSRTGRGGPVV
jgi:hypothetical protein